MLQSKNMHKEDLNKNTKCYYYKGLLRLIFLNNLLHVDIVVPLFIVSLIAKEDMAANF
jgi:hypothetical protein